MGELDNIWILKGRNDPIVTNELNEIIRYKETKVPILIQKFLTNQMTINGKVFQFRYYFILKSVQPVEGYLVDIFQGKESYIWKTRMLSNF